MLRVFAADAIREEVVSTKSLITTFTYHNERIAWCTISSKGPLTRKVTTVFKSYSSTTANRRTMQEIIQSVLTVLQVQ